MLNRMGQAFATVTTLLLATIANAECKQPSERQLIDLAIDLSFQRQAGFASTLDRTGNRVFVRYKLYPDLTTYLAKNSNCCEIATREARSEIVPPDLADRLNYFGSVKVTTNRMLMSEMPDVYDETHLKISTKFYHFDDCGNEIRVN